MPFETELEMAERHVCEGELHVFNQQAMLTYLREHDFPTAQAERVLISIEHQLALRHHHLAMVEAELADLNCPFNLMASASLRGGWLT